MTFDAKEYWEKRLNPNAVGHVTAPAFIYDFVLSYLHRKNTVLEVGPGVGRMLDIYNPEQRITTIDLSTRYQDDIKSKAEKLGLSVTQYHLNSPADQFDFEEDEFELGICVQVLMHVPVEYIENTMREIVRTCREAAVATSLRPGKGVHVFEHDYFKIVDNIDGARINEYKEVGQTGCFLIGMDS